MFNPRLTPEGYSAEQNNIYDIDEKFVHPNYMNLDEVEKAKIPSFMATSFDIAILKLKCTKKNTLPPKSPIEIDNIHNLSLFYNDINPITGTQEIYILGYPSNLGFTLGVGRIYDFNNYIIKYNIETIN